MFDAPFFISAALSLFLFAASWLLEPYKKITLTFALLGTLLCLYLALQPEITFRALEKPREQAHAETTREKRKENVTPKQQTPKPFSNPLAKSTVEIWYMEDVFNARNALKIQKHLESVGAKVSLKLATFLYPVPIDSHIIYYRDPSNLEATIQTEEVVRQDGMQGFRIAALPTSNTDLTITIPIVP